jgi:hypothetical protein
MTFVSDAAQQLLSCFDMALQEGPNPPPDGNICLRVGEVPFSAGLSEDLCCQGLAWVRVLNITPSINFPQADTTPSDCPHSSYAVEFELGAIRCMTFGSIQAGPTCDQWTDVFLQVDEDAASMRRAICCLFDLVAANATFIDQIVTGTWVPIDNQGGCIGGLMTVTVQLTCSEC